MTNKILTPEEDDEVKLHLITHHNVDTEYSLEDTTRKMRNEYRGMLPQALHNFIHRHNHFPENSIEHEHSTKLLAAYATIADGKLKEQKELAN
jgi:hypothetical protein